MNEKLDWTQMLGEASLAQQENVMDLIEVCEHRRRRPGTSNRDSRDGPPEPPRLSRRPHILRGWGHGTSEQVLTGGAGAGGPDGDGAPGGARVAVGGDRIDRGEDRLFDGGPTEVGTPG